MSDELESFFDKLIYEMPTEFQKADRSAIQRAVVTGRASAARAIQKHNSLKIGTIKRSVRVSVSSIKSGSMIKYSGRHIPLMDFDIKMLPNGLIRSKVNRDGSGQTLKHAFVKSEGKYPFGIYQRVTQRRVPLEQLYGPSIPQIISANEDVAKIIENAQSETYAKRLAHNVLAIMNGWWQKQNRSTGTVRYFRVAKKARDMGIDVEVALEKYLKGEDWTVTD